MADSQENIEAKLSAYIDGELAEADRAEIEKHLQANPTHRKLLDDLRRLRVMISALPREKATSELVETLQGQLERSALLDGSENEVILTLRPNRWPQFVSVAAVVLLAVGLATVIYVALPHGNTKFAVTRAEDRKEADNKPLAATQATTTMTLITAPTDETRRAIAENRDREALTASSPAPGALSEAVAAAPTTRPVTPAAVAMSARPTPSESTVPPLTTPTVAAPAEAARADDASARATAAAPGGPFGAGGFGGRAGGGAMPTAETTPGSISSTALGSPAPGTSVVLLVNASDVSVANSRVTDYFTRNNIAYESVADEESQAQKSNDATDKNLAAQKGPMQQMAKQQTNNVFTDSVTAGKSSTASDNKFSVQAQQRAAVANIWNNTQAASGQDANDALFQNRASQQYVARGMTKQQVDVLKQVVSEPVQGQQQQLVVYASPKRDVLKPGDQVQVTVNELVGPGVDRNNVATVSKDGLVTMPMIDPINAAGLTTDELSNTVANRYRESSLINAPTVSVKRMAGEKRKDSLTATQPTTKAVGATTNPVVVGGNAGWAAANGSNPGLQANGNLSADGPIATTVPATSPTTAPVSDADSDSHVEVLVVVQPLDASIPATLPTVAQPPPAVPVAATPTATTPGVTAFESPLVPTTLPATRPTTTPTVTGPTTAPVH